MLIDRPQVAEGSVIINATVPSGTAFPSLPNPGELFFRTDLGSLQTYNGTGWLEAGAVALASHIADGTLHLSVTQNALLDGLSSTLTSAELNFVHGVTAPIQSQLTTNNSGLATHIADMSVHLTPSQNTLLDTILASATELNFSIGLSSSIQNQLDAATGVNNTQNQRLSTLENTTVPTVATNLSTHINDDTVHLTTAQNTLLDQTITNGITAADIQKLSGANTLVSPIPALLNSLSTSKISADGSIGMSGNLSLGGNRAINAGNPINPTDLVTKSYVDSFIQGIHWVQSVKAASTGNLTLSGFQTVDGVSLTNSDRVLVKDQANTTENGIYLVASGAWSRSLDYDAPNEILNSAVFVLAGGATEARSTWIQTNQNFGTVGVDSAMFSAFTGPVVNSAGNGIVLGVSNVGNVSVLEGAGIAFDGNGAVVVDVYTGGGLMLTANNVAPATLTTTTAKLALTESGVTAGNYGSGTQSAMLTIDSKGRTTTAASVTITPAFSSITGTPTTLAGYGITNAVPLSGNVTMSGPLSFTNGTVLTGAAPTSGQSFFSTGPYGVSQGDNRTSFGYNNGGTYLNYIRGSSTIIDSPVTAQSITATSFVGPLTGNASTATLATKASTLSQNGGNGTAMTFSYSGVGGQPTWLWGTNDGTSTVVYNPSNFSVALAAKATTLNNANGNSAMTFSYAAAGGTPTYYWGTNDGATWQAYNPAAMNVGYAANAGNASTATTAGYASNAGNSATTSQTAFGTLTASYVNTSAQINAQGNQGSGIGTATGGLGGIMCQGAAPNAAFMSFHRGGAFAAYLGLDTDNQFAVGGWSMGAIRYVLLHSGNYNSYSPTLAGGGAYGTWNINVAGQSGGSAALTLSYSRSDNANYPIVWMPNSGQSQAYSADACYVNSATGTVGASNLYSTGNVTAYSDIRVKTDIEVIPNALAKIETLRGVTYTRTDKTHEGLRQSGVIAQEVRKVLPEVVIEGDDGMLSVAYGNMAGLFVEAIKALNKEVTELRAELAALRAKDA